MDWKFQPTNKLHSWGACLALFSGGLYFYYIYSFFTRFAVYFSKANTAAIIAMCIPVAVMCCLTLLLAIVTSVGLFFGKRWAKFWALSLVSLIMIGIVPSLVSCGFKNIPAAAGILAVIFSLSLARIIIRIDMRPALRFSWRTRIACIARLLIALLAGYGVFYYFVVCAHDIVHIAARDDRSFSPDYARRCFGNISLMLPRNSMVLPMGSWQKGNMVLVAGKDNNYKIGIGFSADRLVQSAGFKPIHEVFGYQNSYEMERRLCRGFKLWRQIPLPRKAAEGWTEVAVGSALDGFLANRYKTKEETTYPYTFYDKKDRTLATGVAFSLKQNSVLNKNDVEAMVGSLKLYKNPPVSAAQAFVQGLTSLRAGKYHDAVFQLSNALYQAWDNPEYAYYLGLACFNDANPALAKNFVELALKKRPNYPEAKNLLAKISDKIKGKK